MKLNTDKIAKKTLEKVTIQESSLEMAGILMPIGTLAKGEGGIVGIVYITEIL